MYITRELAEVTVLEFRRGLEGLTMDEVLVRHPKASGTRMNAIAWIVAHIAQHWSNARALALEEQRPPAVAPPADGTPPSYLEALRRLEAATADLDWVDEAGDARMSRRYPSLNDESAGTFLLRAMLHTWFHIGEINAIRQLLGHPEIVFVGPFGGRLEWVPEASP